MSYTDYQVSEMRAGFPPFAYVRAMQNNSSMVSPNITIGEKLRLQTDSSVYRDVVTKWTESFNQLKEAQKKENYNADVEMPSKNTISKITHWINEAFEIDPQLNAPDIVPDGEGGLDIEWHLLNKNISIHIDHSSSILNRIFVKAEGRSYSKPISKENLKDVLDS